MLRIYLEEKCESVTVRVEGKIAGESVEALERFCCDEVGNRQDAKLIIDLDEVLIIDQKGEELLQHLYRSGVTLRGRGMHSKYLVERIQQRVAS
jgi:anti-anti-sigma regulatory factor